MEYLSQMVVRVTESPCAHLGKPSLDRLRAYISGFLDQNIVADDGCLDGFNEYIAQKYHMKTDHDWSDYIQFFSQNEQEAFDLFVQYFAEYQKIKMPNFRNTDILCTQKATEQEGFFQMMERVIAFPELYLGNRSLERLHAYLNGFEEHEVVAEHHPLDGFDDYIRGIYNIKTERNWPEIIRFFSPDDQYAFDSFVKHFYIFCEEQLNR